jgi:uncharacterized membrane protein YhaH (DUF805 family)
MKVNKERVSREAKRLGLPLHRATMTVAISRFIRSYFLFSGRASRSEFWWAISFVVVSGGILDVFATITSFIGSDVSSKGGPAAGDPLVYVAFGLIGLWGVLIVSPTYSLIVRRFHDTNRRGWFLLTALIPLVGIFVVITLAALPSQPDGVRFDRLRANDGSHKIPD